MVRTWMMASVSFLFSTGCASVFGIEAGMIPPTVEVSGAITTDTTWYADQTAIMTAHVTVEAGATLTIEAGTRILAQEDTGLVVKPGGRLVAKGTKDAPIVFTSALEVPETGDWQGILFCGRAPQNGGNAGARDTDTLPSEYAMACGGNIDDDDSGELSYVRIEFGGADAEELETPAALQFEGVGSKTIVHHVQVHRAKGDGVAIRGGSLSVKHLLITMFYDDGFDWAYGWNGRAQFIGVVMGDMRGDAGIQSGLGTDDSVVEGNGQNPSNPWISNVTVLGKSDQYGSNVKLRGGTRGHLLNMLIADAGMAGLNIEDDATNLNAENNLLDIRGSIFANMTNFEDDDNNLLESTWALEPARKNQSLTPAARGIATFPFSAVNLSLTNSAPALSGAEAPPNDAFFEATTFIGACGKTCPDFEDWTAFPK
jgi:hypothetical protein